VTGDEQVRHLGLAQGAQPGGSILGELGHRPVQQFPPVAGDQVLPQVAARPEQFLRRAGQQLDVHAGLEYIPGSRESGSADQAGQRPDRPGHGLYLQPLVDVDDSAGRVPGGIDGRDRCRHGVPDDHR
jgi:hypothetical protein